SVVGRAAGAAAHDDTRDPGSLIALGAHETLLWGECPKERSSAFVAGGAAGAAAHDDTRDPGSLIAVGAHETLLCGECPQERSSAVVDAGAAGATAPAGGSGGGRAPG